MNEEFTGSKKEYEPNFLFGGQRVVSEANWEELKARGVRNIVPVIPEDDDKALRERLEESGRAYGVEHLLLGDAYDGEAGRPLRLKPGLGLYATAEGIEQSGTHHGPPILKLGNRRRVARPGLRAEIFREDTGD